MAETYNEKINRYTDWGGDASTDGKPVKGSRVQEFIKEELNGKYGAIYKGDGDNVVYFFANEDDKQKFLDGDTSVAKGSFETTSKYSVKINTDTLVRSRSVIYGTTGNTVEFQFKIVDDNDMGSDSRASIEFSFLASGVIQKYTMETQMNAEGWTTVVSDVIDKYLKKGENTITVSVKGLSSRTSSQFIMTYNLFDLSFDCNFAYNELQDGNVISIPYTVECTETKYLEFFIDGVEAFSNNSAVIADALLSSTANINIADLEAGTHSLQVAAYVRANDGTRFYAPRKFYSFATDGGESPSFLMDATMDERQEVALDGDNLTLNVDQFEQISFDWSIYDPYGRKINVNFEFDGKIVGKSVIDRNGEINTFSFRPMEFGDDKELKIYAYNENNEKMFEYVVVFNVAESSTGIKEATDGLLLKLQSMGRRNDEAEADRETWECVGSDGNVYKATFNDFTWNAQQGWNEETESLTISNGATVEFNIQPMINDWVNNGGTFEIDLETFDIDDENAVICECRNSIVERSSAYFKITATDAEFATANNVKINTRFKDNERLKIAFIGNRKGTHEDGNLIYIVVNGVLERAALYGTGDEMFSDAYLKIGDPNGLCKVRLRSIRVYNKALTVDEAFNNFVIDSDDSQTIYERNNVLKNGTTEIDFDKIANKLPVMIFTGDMVALTSTNEKTDWKRFDVEYINRQEPERNFVAFNAQMKLQGTSSLKYPRKNFKLKTKNKTWTDERYADAAYVLDDTTEVGNKMLKSKANGKQYDFSDNVANGETIMLGADPNDTSKYKALKKGKYRFRENCHKADKWTLKADFMESSGSHNVAAGRSWNDIFENTRLSIDVNAGYENHTYDSDALVSKSAYKEYTKNGISYKINNNGEEMQKQEDYVCRTEAQKICIAEGADDIRTAVDGFPMVCFYRTSHKENNLIFMGQYNFLNDKGSYEVFGFEDIEDPNDEETIIYDASKVECWEGLKNTNPIALFQTIDNWDSASEGWASTFDSRYPDPDDGPLTSQNANDGDRHYDASVGSPLYEFCKWMVSTRHSAITEDNKDTLITDEKITIDSRFAERINSYQYGWAETTKNSYKYEGNVAANGSVTVELPDTPANRQKKFEVEKWEHFDVWKLAGYYIYLRRYGAVDQFVKNTMLFTDGNGKYDTRTDAKYRKWFYINYDNDCLFGVRNNGQLAFHWDLDRTTPDAASDIVDVEDVTEEGANSFAMMGHESTLWNNLEADDEFMRMVRDLDNSMSQYGLNYANMVKEFDTNHTEKWCERVYNANERYKYIYTAKGLGDVSPENKKDLLWMLQGTRRSHRHWWIANHFNLLDAQWLSGDYKNTYVTIKTNCLAGQKIVGRSAIDYYYAWGQKRIYESNMIAKEGDIIEFVFPTDQSQGDPVSIYAINKLSELDFSDCADLMFEGSFEFHIGNKEVANTLKKLVIGNPNVVNTMGGMVTSTWGELNNLEYLDITNYKGISELDLKPFGNLHTLKAFGSSLSMFAPSEGSSFDLVELPSDTINVLSLEDIRFGSLFDDFKYTPTTNLRSLTLSNNHGIDITYYSYIIKPWIRSIENSVSMAALYRQASINVSNINWEFSSLDDVRLFKNFKKYSPNFHLSGRINLSQCGNLSMANIQEIRDLFGDNCFNEAMASMYIITPDSVFISASDTSMVAGESMTFEREIYPDENAIADKITDIKYYLVEETELTKDDNEKVLDDVINGKKYLPIEDIASVRSGLTLTNRKENGKQIGVLSSAEIVTGHDTKVTVLVHMTTINSVGFDKIDCMEFTIKDPTYANEITVNGESSVYKGKQYTYDVTALTSDGEEPIGSHVLEWAISGDNLDTYIGSSAITADEKLIINIAEQPEISSPMTITATWRNFDGTVRTANRRILILNETVIMTIESNPVVMKICYDNGWCTNADALRKSEAEAVNSFGTVFKGIDSAYTFNECVFFTGISSFEDGAFSASNISEITLPSTLTSFGEYCFDGSSALTRVAIEEVEGEPETTILTLPEGVTDIPKGCFRGTSLSQLILTENIATIGAFAFGGTKFKEVRLSTDEFANGRLMLPSGIASIDGDAFEKEEWTRETASNPLEVLCIPKSLMVNSKILRGKKYKKFIVEEGHGSYRVKNDALYDTIGETLIAYPANKEHTEEFVLESNCRLVSAYAFFAAANLDSVIASNTIVGYGIGEHAFECSKIKLIDLSMCTMLTNLQNYTFYGCTELNTILLPMSYSLVSFGMYLFYNCPKLTNIDIPYTITEFTKSSVGDSYTFYKCSFEELILPDTILSMGSHTIEDCDNLVYVKFPKYWGSLETEKVARGMQNASFINDCAKLSAVTLSIFSYTTEDEQEVVVNANMHGNLITSCPKLRYYYNAEEDNHNIVDIVDGVLYTDNGKTVDRLPTGIVEYIMPDTVETAGINFALNCTNLSAITLSNNLKNIPDAAFIGSAIEKIVLPASIESMGVYCFQRIDSLKEIWILGNAPISNIAFSQCQYVEKIVCLVDEAPELSTETYKAENGIWVLHPFGYQSTGFVGMRAVDPVLYIPYNSTGYDSDKWMHPLFDEDKCGFRKEYYPLENRATVVIYVNGEMLTDGVVYAKSESGDFVFGGSNDVYSATYSVADGGFIFNFGGKVYQSEIVSLYTDAECTNKIGEFKAKYDVNEYQVGEPILAAAAPKRSLFSTGLFGASVPTSATEEEERMAEITQKQYEELCSKINNLMEVINRLQK